MARQNAKDTRACAQALRKVDLLGPVGDRSSTHQIWQGLRPTRPAALRSVTLHLKSDTALKLTHARPPSHPPHCRCDVPLARADDDGVEVCSHDDRAQLPHLAHQLQDLFVNVEAGT